MRRVAEEDETGDCLREQDGFLPATQRAVDRARRSTRRSDVIVTAECSETGDSREVERVL